MSKYKHFEMGSKETIQEMFTRYTNITNELVSLIREIAIAEQVRKVLRSLLYDERWRAKVTTLQETKDLTKFNIEKLAGSLTTHELHLGTNVLESSRNKGLALRAEVGDEAAMLVRRFKKFYNMLSKGKGKNFGNKNSSSEPNPGCFKYGGTDHIIDNVLNERKK